ncbi:hypothetical protein K466DRAFT_667064 [Polyporus arcularius HHB13444]|uniref:Uncharacterized protein n=1 Tax=Polyporus arcularius HHB13444 TaxID=1314778 RepID=A0A5C3NW03_9APHY|nr:hypothetical protein K466DRAFT_667064 [Polyporus arcularius HHB13444]
MRLFPNAVEVTIDGVYPYSGDNAGSRLADLRDQDFVHESPAKRLQPWGTLRRVRGGSALEVHWLGFRSPVLHLDLSIPKHLDLGSNLDITIPKHFYWSITLVLQYAQPRRLTLRTPDPDCMPPSLDVDSPASSTLQRKSHDLTHLIMRIPRGNCSRCGLKGVFTQPSSGEVLYLTPAA